MKNVLKMDLFRLAHSRSTYIIIAGLAMLYLFMTALDAQTLKNTENKIVDTTGSKIEEQPLNGTEENNTVKLIETDYHKDYKVNTKSRIDMLAGVFSGNIMAMAFIIFAGLFAGGMRRNRFEKNIRGAVGRKYRLVFSNFIVCMFLAAIVIFIAILFSLLGYAIFYPAFYQLPLGIVGNFGAFIIVYYFLLICLCVIMSAFVEIVGNQVTAIVTALIYGSGIIYDFIDYAAAAVCTDFSIKKYLPIGNLYELSLGAGSDVYLRGVVLAVCYSTAALCIHVFVKERRDIVC